MLFVEDLAGTLVVLPLLWTSPPAGTTERLVILAPLVGATVSLIVAVCDLTRRRIRLLPRHRWTLAVEMLRFGIKGYLARLANTLSWRLDMMILSTLGSAEAVGYYAVATKVAETVRPLSGSLNFVLRPVFAGLPAGEARTQGVRLLRSFDPSAPPDADVPDPYYGGPRGFDEVFDICERACRGLLDHLRRAHGA